MSDGQNGVCELSVCICTYNGAARLRVVLEALPNQTLASPCWEVLVIDNASTDDTGGVARQLVQEFLPGRGRVINEAQAGLSFARARAVQAARGKIVCFLDDDNIPSPTFLNNALKAFGNRPKAGVIGGKVLPRWEVTPTPLAEKVAPFALAICDLGDSPVEVHCEGGGIVGAGMCARTEVLRAIYRDADTPGKVTGRKGSSLMSGEDLVISVRAREMGWECWYEPSLVIEHCLPAGRMQKDYLLRLFEGIGRGQAATRKVYDWKARTPLGWLIGLKDFCRWQKGFWFGPPAELVKREPALAQDLHEVNQRLVWGRARQALGAFWR